MSSEKYSPEVLRDPATPLSVLLEGLHEDEKAVTQVVENPALPSDVLDVLARFPLFYYFYSVGDDDDVDLLPLLEKVAAVHAVWVKAQEQWIYGDPEDEWDSGQFYWTFADFHQTQASIAKHPNTSSETLDYLLGVGLSTTSTMGFALDEKAVDTFVLEWINQEGLLTAIAQSPHVSEETQKRIVRVGNNDTNRELADDESTPASVLDLLADFPGDEESGFDIGEAVANNPNTTDFTLAKIARAGDWEDFRNTAFDLLRERLIEAGVINEDEEDDEFEDEDIYEELDRRFPEVIAHLSKGE